ncbi:MAG: hypothetical protein Q9190_005404 [Brigantiaea leucoxantha]
MGNSDSKLVFKQGIFKLSSSNVIPPDDIYWTGVSIYYVFGMHPTADLEQFWKLPESTEDVFSLFTPVDVRRARDSSLSNIEILLTSLVARLTALRHTQAFPDSELAPEREALNCIRVLTRVLPFLYEADHLDTWEERFFWERRKEKSKKRKPNKTEVLFDDSQLEGTEKLKDEEDEDEFEEMKPLGEELIDTLIDLLFYTNFTVPRSERSKSKVTYAIWQSGALKYNPATWRVPYDHVVYKDPKQIHVSYCIQFLLVLLLYPIPDGLPGPPQKNYFRHFLGRVHRPQDLQFLIEGMMRTLNQPLQATSSYLPGSQKPVLWAPEMIMLFWEILQCNKRFRSYIIDGRRGNDFVVLILFYTLEYKTDPAKQGVVRMCVFVLQTLSTEPEFGKALNEIFSTQASLPAHIRLPEFHGTYADFLITSIHALITTSKGKLDAIYPALLATINNVAAYVRNLTLLTSSRLLHLFASMSAPNFLLANETNYALLQSLLESLNAIVEHQYKSNRTFARAVLKSKRRFEALRSFTLESGQEEINRLHQRRKDSGDGFDSAFSPSSLHRSSSIESARSPQNARTPSLSDVPEEGGTFTVGDDDSDDEDQTPILTTPSHSSPSGQNTRTPSRSSSVDEPLPTQLRGMSEKARGKMPAGQLAFSRHNSSTSLNSHAAALMSPTVGFHPSAHWVRRLRIRVTLHLADRVCQIESWLPSLPLHTILTLLDSSNPSTGAMPKTLPTAIDPSPPRIHLFSWTPLSLGWYESLLWGFIFASEMVIQKGTVGVWNSTSIRLFKVEKEAVSGPSLTRPLGAVDAVGSNLVQRIGRMGVKVDTAAPRGGVRDV